MNTVDVTLTVPEELFRSVERNASAAGVAPAEYLLDAIRARTRTEEDDLAMEGYRELASEAREFAASAMASLPGTWPEWEDVPSTAAAPRGYGASTPGTCRAAVLEAARAVVQQTGRPEFTTHDILTEMRRRGSRYAEGSIRTHISAYMTSDSRAGEGGTGSEFVRLRHGVYRLRSAPVDEGAAHGE